MQQEEVESPEAPPSASPLAGVLHDTLTDISELAGSEVFAGGFPHPPPEGSDESSSGSELGDDGWEQVRSDRNSVAKRVRGHRQLTIASLKVV